MSKRNKCKSCTIGILESLNGLDILSEGEISEISSYQYRDLTIGNYGFKYCPDCGNEINWEKLKKQWEESEKEINK